ncbi:MAG TPA: diguanylate cyclase [Terracidiphilus sp.]|nr:diguanylate cyclase [Terracidiphilus sp.]
MAFLVLLNLAANITQAFSDFGSLNEQTARRLDTLSSAIALRVQDRAKVVDHSFMMVGDAIATGALSDQKLRQIAMLDTDTLGNISITVFGSGGRLLATSTPLADREQGWFQALIGMKARFPVVAEPVHYGPGWGLLSVRDHHGEAGAADMRIAIVVPVNQVMMAGVGLPPGSAALLLNHEDRVIARYPKTPAVETGSVFHIEGVRTEGPTPSTFYSISPQDGRNRLKTSRNIIVGESGDIWKLELGYAVDEYRAPWLHSLYLNLLGMAIEVTLLVAGVVMLRHENHLHEQVETWAGFVSTVIRNIPAPVALVDVGTGKITLANDALVGFFGERANVGERLSMLFADPANWSGTGAPDSGEPVAMLGSSGTVEMVVRCVRVHDLADEATGKGLILVTFTDVSRQCEQISQLRSEAEFDALTKLPNRRHFARASERAVAHACQGRSPLAVLALDLDHFKRVNDTWGHAAGDRVLEVVAGRINGALRDQDLPGRIGGEEFAVILRGATAAQAHAVAERIRLGVAGTPIVLSDGQAASITASIGIAMYASGEPDLSAAQARADAALYRAKQMGRNRVVADSDVVAQEQDRPQSAA